MMSFPLNVPKQFAIVDSAKKLTYNNKKRVFDSILTKQNVCGLASGGESW